MKKPLSYSIAIIGFLCVSVSFNIKAGTPSLVKSQSILNGPNWSFRENKGQLMDANHKPLNDIPYYGKQGGVNIYCKPGAISFVFTKTENNNQVSEATGSPEVPFFQKMALLSHQPITHNSKLITASRADLVFLGANPNAEITASNLQTYYENYYTTGDANHGITNVRTYKTITYKNIYPNIDMVLEAKEHGMEYSFIVYPGGDIADIQLQWNGLDNIKELENGGISYSLPNNNGASLRENPNESSPPTIGSDFTRNPLRNNYQPLTFTETAPVCYLETTPKSSPIGRTSSFAPGSAYGSERTPLPMGERPGVGSFLIHSGSRISFSVSDYDKTKTLIIDPTLDWGTYYGGSGYTSGQGITHDANNNIYITGWTTCTAGIATLGTYQTNYAGGYEDVFVAKFTSSGSLAWGTYYGGSGRDMGEGITIDTESNVYITGGTYSTNGIVTHGAYQTTSGGAFVAKFTSSGSLAWGTYYGGGGGDWSEAISHDANNNIYITGYTSSTNNIATSGAYQTSPAGSQVAFVAKFNSSGSLAWGTYSSIYGIAGNNVGQGITTDANSNVYITGETYQTSKAGGFVAKYNSLGNFEWGKYCNYGGSGITADANNNVYITGSDFVAKFTSSDSLVWETNYGGNGTAITADADNNIYITGWTVSSSDIATSGAYKTSWPGGQDAFVAKFTSSGSLSWGTYYGGSNKNWGEGITIDTNNNVYITGYVSDTSDIATYGAYQTSLAGNQDAFMAKFDTNTINSIYKPQVVFLNLKVSPNPFTTNLSISYTLPEYQNVQLTLTDITGKQIATLFNENENAGPHTYGLDADKYNIPAGTYILRIVAGGEAVEAKVVRVK